jgi:phage FluMu protein Com
MPIRFRCAYCNRLLGIATRKAGTETTCPHCGYTITVPYPDDSEKTERVNLADVEALLKRAPAGDAPGAGGELTQKSGVLTAPPLKAAAPVLEPASKPEKAAVPKGKAPVVPQKPRDPNESAPLFEADLDALLGASDSPVALDRAPEPQTPASAGTDARSLGDPAQHVTLSSRAATLLMALVLVLLVLAFALGYYVAPRGK